MTRSFRNSIIEVLSSAQVNHLRDDGKEILQIMPGSTPGYFMVEHIDRKELLKGEVGNGPDQWTDDQGWA